MKTRVQARGYFGKFTGRPSRFFIHAAGESGFTLVELMVTIVISLFALAATTTLFAQLFTQFKQESRVSQTDIGSALGLEYLRKDIQSAGYGLPWNVTGVAYNESAIANALTNDVPPNAPRAIFSINGKGLNGSDYLVIKSQMAAVNDSAAGKSTRLDQDGKPWPWNDPNWDLNPSDNVIVVSTIDNTVSLVNNAGAFSVLYNGVSAYAPTSSTEKTRMIYGVADAADAPNGLRMPYNRADYFIDNSPDDIAQPQRCAPGTGQLVKAVVNQKDGNFTYYPILHCVADMQVIFDLGNNSYSNDIFTNPLNAAQIRQQVQGVRVYILAQEGQKDPSYTYPSNSIYVGEFGMGHDFPLTGDQKHYRWKVYHIIEKPMNLGQ